MASEEERKRAVIVAGHICVDLMPRFHHAPDMEPGQLFDVGPLTVQTGGCVGNTGLDLVALGAPVRLVADIGDDELGRMLEDLVSRAGASADDFRVVPGAQTSYSIVIQPPNGDRAFWHHVGANAGFTGSAIDLEGADLLHLGYPPILPGLYAEGGRCLAAVLGDARSAGVTTSVDLATFDSRSAAADEDWPSLFGRTLPLIDLFLPSYDDLVSAIGPNALDGPDVIRRMGSEMLAAGAAVVMIKMGADGLYLRTAGAERLAGAGRAMAPLAASWASRELWAPSLKVDVMTTTGAGDAAVAGLLAGVVAGLGPVEALQLAAAAGAMRVSQHRPLAHWHELAGMVGDELVFRPLNEEGWEQAHDGIARGPADITAQDHDNNGEGTRR